MKSSAPIDTPERFKKTFDVSRETIDRMIIYERLLRQWQKGANLVSRTTLDSIWHRHFADSAQLIALARDWNTWLDLGTGAGFPGLVIAICEANREDRVVHIVESNARKCAFCHEVVRETGCPVEIHEARIESLGSSASLENVDIVSSRALAPLGRLLDLSAPFFGPGTVGLFLKGRAAGVEHQAARQLWQYEAALHSSMTDGQACIIEVKGLQRR